LTGFFSYNRKPLGLLIFAILLFSMFWLLFSKIGGNFIYLEFPWGTFVTENTFTTMLIASSRWATVMLAGLYFMIITSENDIINSLTFMRIPRTAVLSVTIAFNTVGFAIRDLGLSESALKSRDYNSSKFINKLKKPYYIGNALLLANLKRIETLHQSYLLRETEEIKNA
jgi:energy-coupling factor transporter transmembrane protein EcfT